MHVGKDMHPWACVSTYVETGVCMCACMQACKVHPCKIPYRRFSQEKAISPHGVRCPLKLPKGGVERREKWFGFWELPSQMGLEAVTELS